jgi:hypothetical protein
MAKVLVERPRDGWRVPRDRGRSPRALDDSPQREGMRFGATKRPGEHLGPLGKYLGRQVGRPWNKVFSEMRERIKPGNTVQEHILTHIGQFLIVDAEKVTPSQQAPCGIRRAPHKRRWSAGIDEGMLYVDPDDGLIKRTRRRLKGPRPAAPRDAEPLRRLADDRIAYVRGGVWCAFTLAAYALIVGKDFRPVSFAVAGIERRALWHPTLGDILPGDHQKLAELDKAYGPGLAPLTHRQLSRRELRANRLKNAAST